MEEQQLIEYNGKLYPIDKVRLILHRDESLYWQNLCNNKKLYDVYWGGFKIKILRNNEIVDNYPDYGIIENRNKFEIDYNIKKKAKRKDYWNLTNRRDGIFYVHIEVYLSDTIEKEGKSILGKKFEDRSNRYIVVISQYDLNTDYTLYGWTKIYNLYSNCANTYIKEFPYTKEEFIKKIDYK